MLHIVKRPRPALQEIGQEGLGLLQGDAVFARALVAEQVISG
jgi:hypothetical protein